MSIGRICRREVHLADPDESLRAAAERMASRKVGTLVVLDDERRPTGIVTDRDLVVRGMARGEDPDRATVEDVMTLDVHTVPEDTPIEDALRAMRAEKHRRLLVVDEGGALVGLVSLDDVLTLLSEELGQVGALVGAQEPPPMLAAPNREETP